MDPVQLGLVASILSGVCTAAWTVLTWQTQQAKEEEIKRDRNAALYVNPYIMAAEELQDALYQYLSGSYHKIPNEEKHQSYAGFSAAALEIVYTIVVYFGWSLIIYRYGPYTSDEKLIELTRQVSESFSAIFHSSESEEDPFYFSYPEQKALGMTFVRPITTPGVLSPHQNSHRSAIEEVPFLGFEAITLYDFEEEIKHQRNEHSALYLNIRDALSALDQFDPEKNFHGRERLVMIQNYLVDLVNYLEQKEEFSLAVNKRRRVQHHQTFVDLFGYVQAEIVHHIPGRLRIRFDHLKGNLAYGLQLESFLASVTGVRDVRLNLPSNSIVVEYDPKIYTTEELKQVCTDFLRWKELKP